MKRRWMGFAWCAIGAAMILGILAFALGQKDAAPPSLNPVRLSKESGFYDSGFELELYCDAGEIHYTLDSSDPTEESPVYTGPIHIGDASPNENVYSAITEVSLDLNEDILAKYDRTGKYGFRVPSAPVDKATVVRAVCVDALGKTSSVITGVYFVGFDSKKGYDGIGIMSITTDPGNLFDYDRGIYVLGKTFDQSLEAWLEAEPSGSYSFWPANYRNRGRLWERRASICFFDAERRLTLSGDYGIRIQGRDSRSRLPKGLNIYARQRYGADSFPGDILFGLDYTLHSLNLNAGGNDEKTKLTDYLVNDLASDMNFGTRVYKPYALFLDGEYWGVYWLTPRYKKDYFAGEYGLSSDEVIEVKFNSIEVGKEEDYQPYQDMLDYIASNDMSDMEYYARACEMIDMDSCIDYYAAEIYIDNHDWPHNNFSLWRSREKSDKPCADEKWRWLIYDVNMSMSSSNAKQDSVQRAASRDAMFCSLLDNPGFEEALYAKLLELAQDRFSPGRVDVLIDGYEAMMADAMEKEYLRFYDGDRSRQDFLDGCEDIRTFFHKRYDYITEVYGER